jgi:hypothetical protein
MPQQPALPNSPQSQHSLLVSLPTTLQVTPSGPEALTFSRASLPTVKDTSTASVRLSQMVAGVPVTVTVGLAFTVTVAVPELLLPQSEGPVRAATATVNEEGHPVEGWLQVTLTGAPEGTAAKR